MPKTKSLISVVDDDESMREAVRVLMKSLGFTAEAFASAEEFLNSRQLPRTCCLITDVQMPGMTGLELHRHLVALARLGQPDGISRSRMAEMLEVDKAGPKVRC